MMGRRDNRFVSGFTQRKLAVSALHPRPSTLSRAAFVEAYGGIYEHSPWVAETVHDAGLGDADAPDALASRMAAVVDAASDAAKLTLLRAHPELAGKLAVAGALTAQSTSEQAGAGLDQCTAEEFAEFTRLNDSYTARFGFPFIIAVASLDRQAILEAFRVRVDNNAELEFETALKQVHRIARFRLEAMAA